MFGVCLQKGVSSQLSTWSTDPGLWEHLMLAATLLHLPASHHLPSVLYTPFSGAETGLPVIAVAYTMHHDGLWNKAALVLPRGFG